MTQTVWSSYNCYGSLCSYVCMYSVLFL